MVLDTPLIHEKEGDWEQSAFTKSKFLMNLTAAFSDKITRFVSDRKGIEVIYLKFRKVFDIVFCNKGGSYCLGGLNKQMAKKTWLDAQAQRVVVNRLYFT